MSTKHLPTRRRTRLASRTLASLAWLAGLSAPALFAQTASVWTGSAGDGLWATAANWTAGVPDGDAATADFSQLDLAADLVVSLEAVTVNRLVFGDTTPGGGNLYLADPLFSYTLTLAGASPTITVGNLGSNVVSLNYGGGALPLVASGGFIKDGPGRLELSGNSTLGSSRIVVRGGTLGAPNASSLNSASVIELAGGNLAFGAGTFTFAAALDVQASGSLTFGNNSKTISGAFSGPAGVVLTVGQTNGAAVTTSFAGDLTNYRGELVLSNRYFRLDTPYAASFAASGANAIWTINTGVTGNGSGDGALFYRNGVGGTDANVTATFALGALQGTGILRGGGAAGLGTVIWEIGALGLDTTFSGRILEKPVDLVAPNENAFTKPGITKVGSGSLTLTGTNTYTGRTAVNAGSLVVNGDHSAATGAITVAAGAALRGIGVLGGATTVAGTLAPGLASAPGTLTTRADLTFTAGSVLRLRAAAAAHDTLVVENSDTSGATTRTLTLGGTLRLEVSADLPVGETTLLDRRAHVALAGDFASAELAIGSASPVALQPIGGVWTGIADGRDYAFDPQTGILLVSGGAAPTALESWRQTHFETTEPVGDAANDADPDGDGLPNLLEYALGTLPRVSSTSPLALARDVSGHLTLTFPVRSDATLTYVVQASDNLASWGDILREDGSTLAAGGATHTATDPEPLSAHPRRFLRLVVEPAP